jgi:hypothetical protein
VPQPRRLNPATGTKRSKALVWARTGNDRGRPPSASQRPQRTRRAPVRLGL